MNNIHKRIFIFASLVVCNVAFAQEKQGKETEIEVPAKDCQCTTEVNLPVSDQYATLEKREIGSP